MRGFALFAAVAACAAMLTGCAPEEEDTSKDFTYTITDSAGTNFVFGSSLAVIHGKASGCAPTDHHGAFKRTASTVITNTSAPVVLKFSLDFDGAYVEGGYMDMGNNGHLSNGDLALGPAALGVIWTVCYTSMGAVASHRTLDWTNDLVAFFGGPVVWAGGDQPY